MCAQPPDSLDIRHERTDRGQGSPSGLSWWQRLACGIVKAGPVPRHVAFIMDGNRRFARLRGWDVGEGHRLGYVKLEEALRWCNELGVEAVTVYAFSLENFRRTSKEVDDLMTLSEEKLRQMSKEEHMIQQQGMRVRVVGDLSRVSESLHAEMQHVMRMTQDNSRQLLNICFSYTSRNEIASAMSKLASACAQSKLMPCDVSEELLERCLISSSVGCPAVDLLVRTSGEKRLSDFLLWQSTRCVVIFTRVLWPDLALRHFLWMIVRFQLAQPRCLPLLRPRPETVAAVAVGAKRAAASSPAWHGAALVVLALCTAVAVAVAALSEAATPDAHDADATHTTHAAGARRAALVAALAWLAVALCCSRQVSTAVGAGAEGAAAGDDEAESSPRRKDAAASKPSRAKCAPVPSSPASTAQARRVREFVAQLSVEHRL